MTQEMKINKCGCGGEVGIYTAKDGNMWVQCMECRVGIVDKYLDSLSHNELIEMWNTAHPEISNAMQAVKLLEQGEWLEEEETKQRMQLRNGKIFVLHQDEDYAEETHIDLSTLFVRNWQLYEEPKYKEVTFIYAMTQYLKKSKVTAYFKDEDEEYTLQENDEHGIGLSNARLNNGKCLTTDIINNAVWRIYEEQSND